MDSIKSIELMEKYQKKIKAMFKELVSDECYNLWEDTFDIEGLYADQVIIAYHGTERIKKFKNECQEVLVFCVCSVVGSHMDVRIVRQNDAYNFGSKTKQNLQALKFCAIGMMFVCIAVAIIVVLCSYIDNRNFRETFYITSSIKVDSRVRVIQLSDLHGASYGTDNEKLLDRIRALKPDIIICTGDMVDSVMEDSDAVVALAAELSEIAPSYYIYGNNEVESVYDFPLNEEGLDKKFGFDQTNRDETALLSLADSFEARLEHAGITVLKNEMDTIMVRSLAVDVYGVLTSNPSSFWSYSGKAFSGYIDENPDHLKITAVHSPLICEVLTPDSWGDLVLAGHTHGGVARIPVLGPIYTSEGGLLPERGGSFVYGRYDAQGSPLIVGSGLENSNIFRINNQPELVIIDINKY